MNKKFQWYDCIFLLLFFYLFILQLQVIWPFTIDDMYIPLRYAKNWVAGNGLLWNVNSSPVEGYSNFIFVVLGAIALALKGNPVVTLKVAGIIGLFFTCYFIYLISRFRFDKRASLLSCIILLFYRGQIIWTASGLETTVYEALISGSVYFCFKGLGYHFYPELRRSSENRYFVFAAIFLALAGFTRPEAPVLMVLFFILICWDKPKDGLTYYWWGIVLFCLTLLIIYAPYFSWRLFYFGYLFPNPVYCKGLSQTLNFFLDTSYLKLIWPFAILVFFACINVQDKRHFFLWLPSIFYLMMLADADSVVAFDNRLFLPAFILLLPLVLQGIINIEFIFWKDKNFLMGLPLYLGCFLVIFFFIPKMSLAEYRYFCQNPLRGEQLRNKVIHWLDNHADSKDTVVLADSGMIPYKSILNFIDSYCLNNLAMAHSLLKNRYKQLCHEVLAQKPAIIILTSLFEQGTITYTPSDACLKNALNGTSNYRLVTELNSNNLNSNYRYEIYSLR